MRRRPCLYHLTADTGHTFTLRANDPRRDGQLPPAVVTWIRDVWLPGIVTPGLRGAAFADVEAIEPLQIGPHGPEGGNIATWIGRVGR